MDICNYGLFWTENPNFRPKNADVIKNKLKIQNFFRFYEISYRVLIVCQKLAVKRYLIKSLLGRVIFTLSHESNVHKKPTNYRVINMKSKNTKIKLGMSELPTGSAMVSEPPGTEVLGNTSKSGVIELPAHKHEWTQEGNRMLWKCYFESDKNFRGYMVRMHRLWIERTGREMTKQRLRTQVQNIEIVGAGRAEDDIEPFNEESYEVDGDLEVANEEELNRIDVAEVCVSVERSVDVCWRGKEIRLLKDEEKKILRRLREVMLMSQKTQLL